MKEDKFFNVVTIGNYQYKINTMNAFDGSNVFLFVTKKIIPILKGIKIDIGEVLKKDINESLNEIGDMISPILEAITPEELKDVMATCLSHVDILLPAGYVRLYKGGVFAVEEIEYSTKTCFVLCYHVIKPLVNDFFGEKSLSLFKNLKMSLSESQA